MCSVLRRYLLKLTEPDAQYEWSYTVMQSNDAWHDVQCVGLLHCSVNFLLFIITVHTGKKEKK